MADFKIQRGVIVVTGTELTKTITAGTEYTAPSATSKAFIRIVAHSAAGSGASLSDFAGATDLNTWEINNPSNLLTSITFERADQNNDPHRIHWEIIEYIGAASGANEFVVRHEESLAFGTADTAKSTASISGITTEADVCVFLTSAQSSEGLRRGILECMYTTSISSSVATITRGYATKVGNASLAVVEFTGSNWTVQRISHAFSTADTEENETITSVGDLAKTFLETQGMVTVDANDGKFFGYASWLSTTTNLKFRKYALTAGTDTGVTWVISNSQSGTGAMNVVHKSGTTTVSGDPFSLAVSISTTVGLSEIGLGGFCANPASDAGTDNHLYMIGAYVTSTSNVQLESGRDKETRDYYFDVIEWPTEAAGGADTLLADDLESDSEVSTPAIGQAHVLLADDVQSLSQVSTPSVGQAHVLLADDIESDSEVSSPALAHIHVLLADDLQSLSQVSTPSVGQSHVLLADDIELASEVSSPALAHIHVLLADNVDSAAEVTSPAVVDVGAGVDPLLADDIESTSEVSSPVIGQIHGLSADNVQSLSQVSSPALTENTTDHDLFADDIESASEVSTSTLAQVHVLFADNVESVTEVSSPAIDAAEILATYEIDLKVDRLLNIDLGVSRETSYDLKVSRAN